MAKITVKNIPSDLYERLKQAAEANSRSINSEIIVCIERAMYSRKINPDDLLAKARSLREKTAGQAITDDEFSQAKAVGRP